MSDSSRKPLVIVTRKLPDPVEVRMQELFETELNLTDQPLTRAQLMDAVKRCEVLVPTVTDKIDAGLIGKAGDQLRLIANYGNGMDNIDVAAAARKGIIVTNTPNVLDEDTADMTIGLMIAVSRRLNDGIKVMASDRWAGWSPTWMLGRRISGKNIGIIGMGRVGAAVARRAKVFGLSIHYHNRERAAEQLEDELEATHWDSLDQMLARMDIVSVNCPYTPATYHLLSQRRLALLKPDAIIINTARGEIIDEDALIKALEAGKIAGAGLDVFEDEPTIDPRFHALMEKGYVVILPHMSSATIEARIDMGERVVINIKTLIDGHRPPDRVLPIDR